MLCWNWITCQGTLRGVEITRQYLIHVQSKITIQLQHKNTNNRYNHSKLSCIYNMKTYQAEIQSRRKAQLIGNLKAISWVFKEWKAHSRALKSTGTSFSLVFNLAHTYCFLRQTKLQLPVLKNEELSSRTEFTTIFTAIFPCQAINCRTTKEGCRARRREGRPTVDQKHFYLPPHRPSGCP